MQTSTKITAPARTGGFRAAAAAGLAVGGYFLFSTCIQQHHESDEAEVDYNDVEYWNWRYQTNPEHFDWFGDWKALRPWLAKVLHKGVRILHLGCGTSVLPEQMYDCGYSDIVNVDSSQACLDVMSERNRVLRPELQWLQADVRDLRGKVSDGEYSVVLEKSTLDAVGDNDHDADAERYISEVHRVLRPGGVFVMFSLAPPTSRLPFLEQHFECSVDILYDHRCFLYTCRKTELACSKGRGQVDTP